MAAELTQLPGRTTMPPAEDPDRAMGLALAAYQRRKQTIQTLKIAAVWIVLILIIYFALVSLNVDFQYAISRYGFILTGLAMTIRISVLSILFATVLALLGALGRLSHNSIALGISGFYVSFIRGTPLLIQIFLIYNGLPQIGQQLVQRGIPIGNLLILSGVWSGILALSLNYGAYMTEIFRAGIQSIAHGQREAAESIGMTRWQTMRRVILPQAVRIIIPDIGNQFIAMQKDSALVSYMGIWEITYIANRTARIQGKFLEMFIAAALTYWGLTIVSSWLESRLERWLSHAYER